MTSEQYIEKQKKVLQDILVNNRPLKLAALTAHRDITERIFIKGLNSNEGRIGSYDTKRTMYINPNASPRAGANKAKGIEGLKPTKGKHGKHKFKNGKVHKTTYVNNYKDFRNRIGRRIDTVDLVLSGDLKSDFANGKTGTPKRRTQHEYIVTLSRPKNQDKRDGIENKYGRIFNHTKSEVQKFKKVAELELRNQFERL